MQFNNSATSGIVYTTRFYAKANSNDLTNQDITNLANVALDEVYPIASQADRSLQFDDPNYADDPYESFNFSAGVERVSLGVDANSAAVLGVRKVAINTGSGWKTLPQGSLDDYDSQKFIEGTATNGVPERFFLFGTDIVLSPAPNYTSTIRVFYRRALKYFTSSDTTATPGFALPFHELVPLIAAHRWCLREGKTTTAQQLEKQISQKKEDMLGFYSRQNEGRKGITGAYSSPY